MIASLKILKDGLIVIELRKLLKHTKYSFFCKRSFP